MIEGELNVMLFKTAMELSFTLLSPFGTCFTGVEYQGTPMLSIELVVQWFALLAHDREILGSNLAISKNSTRHCQSKNGFVSANSETGMTIV